MAGDGQAVGPQRVDGPHRHVVAGAPQCGGQRPPGQQTLHRLHPGAHGVGRVARPDNTGAQSQPLHGLGKPLLLLRNGAVLRAVGQQGDVPVAQAGQVLHRQRPAAAVVAQEDVLLLRVGLAADENHRRGAAGRLDVGHVAGAGGHNEGPHLVAHHYPAVPGLQLLAAVAAAQHDAEAQLRRRRADLVEEGAVGGVFPHGRDHHADGAGLLEVEVPGGQVGRIAHLLRNLFDPLLGGGGNIRGIPQGLGYRHMGQPRRLPDGFQGWPVRHRLPSPNHQYHHSTLTSETGRSLGSSKLSRCQRPQMEKTFFTIPRSSGSMLSSRSNNSRKTVALICRE